MKYSTPRIRTALRCAAAALLTAIPASAERLAYEGFDYTAADGTTISGLTGGTGWDAAFPAPGGTMALRPGLSYTGLTTAGKAMRWNPSAVLNAGRPWENASAAPADGTYWFSVLVNAAGISQGNFNWMFSTNSGNGQNGIGFRTSNDGGGGLNFKPVFPDTDGNNQVQAGTGSVGTPAFIVARFVMNRAAGSTLRIWVNPDPQVEPTDADPNTTEVTVSAANSATLRPSITGRAFSTGGGDPASNYLEFDEVRVGTSYADVVATPSNPLFDVNASTGIETQPLVFTWQNIPAGATGLVLTPGNVNLLPLTTAGSGTTTIPAPAAATVFRMTLTQGASSTFLEQTFTPVPASFTLSPQPGFAGDTVVMNWRIPPAATTAVIEPGTIDARALTAPATGVGTFSRPAPAATTTYTLTYTLNGTPVPLTKEFVLSPSRLLVTPATAIAGVTPLTINWRILPNWDENALPEQNEVVLEYGPVAGPFTTQTVTAETNASTGAGALTAPFVPGAADAHYRLRYFTSGVETTLTSTISVTPQILTNLSALNSIDPVPPTISASPMTNGVLAYKDRGHVWAAVPSFLQGAQFVQFAQNDKNSPQLEVSFTAGADATFFLFLDNRIGDNTGGTNPAAGTDNPPTLGGTMAWVLDSGFVDSGVDIGLDENPVASGVTIDQSYSVYFRQVNKDELFIFKEQNDGNTRNMYGVAAIAPRVVPVTFFANPASINEGESSTLNWTVPVGSTVSISPAPGDVTAVTDALTGVGSQIVTPAATQKYTLTYDPPGANTPAVSLAPVTVTIIPTAAPEPREITEITFTPGVGVSLSWAIPAEITDPQALTDVVQRSVNLIDWPVLNGVTVTISNGIATIVDPNPPAGGRVFYRVGRF